MWLIENILSKLKFINTRELKANDEQRRGEKKIHYLWCAVDC